MLERHPHDEAAALKVVISASTSFAIMILDFVWLIRDEAKLIWPRLRTSWIARIYLLTRYVGLASQIFNICFTVRMYLGVYTSPAGCLAWFTFQAVVIQFLLAFVEGLLMHRLYALFLHDRLVLMILISFAVGQVASMVVSAGLSFPSNMHTVTCMLLRSNPGSAFFSATTITINLIIFFMTFWRYLRLPAKWTQQGVGRVVMRDSALSLSAISAVMLFMTLSAFRVIKPSIGGNITYYWFVCVLWISIGRIIVNHEKLPRDDGEQGEGSTWRGTLQLTSQIEMGQSTLTLDTQCGSSDGSSSNTLQSSLSTPMTKASQFSPSGSSPSDSLSKLFAHHSPSDGYGRRHSPQPLDTKPSVVSISDSDASRFSPLTVCTDAPQTADHPKADADTDRRVHSPSPSPQRSSPGP
ncbi:hypothetical protein HD554DRAFT_1750440 [Boletus coccyginus]|nr:hypothetical protein HD554DRAFT_1750440 [Boletus coccyginus]